MTTLTPYNLTEAHRIYVERIAPRTKHQQDAAESDQTRRPTPQPYLLTQ